MSLTIIRKVSVTGGAVLRAANNLGDVASAATSRSNLDVNSTAEVAGFRTGLAPRPGIISTGASAVGTTQDNTGLAFGTGNLTIGAWVRLADWTPGVVKYLMAKNTGATALSFYIDGSNRLAIEIGASAYHSTATLTVTDGAWAYLTVTIERSGNATWYINGAAFGTAANISGSAATTLTGTGALAWLSSSSGGSLTAGTIGETFIVSGLLTATNIADIYRAGSIAPFAASFTFFQWCDFGQGYGPIIKDRSGQNQPALMGTSGLSHAVPRNPPGVPQRAPRAALVADGSTGPLIYSTLGTQDPSTGDVTVWADFVFPTADATSRRIFSLAPSVSNVAAAKAFELAINSSVGTFLRLYGATTSDQRLYTLPIGFATVMAGKRCVVAARRGVLYIGVDGDFLNITNLAVETTAGTPPAWTDDIDGTYLIGLSGGTAAASTATQLFDLRLANVAMTEAQLRTEYERGEPGAEWQGATNTSLLVGDDGSFASTGNWTPGSGNSISGGALNLVASNNAQCNASSQRGGGVYRTTLVVSANTGQLQVYNGSGFVNIGTSAQTGTLSVEVAQVRTDLTFFRCSTGAATIDSASVIPLGYTSRLRTDTAAGLTALDGSANKQDFVLSTTGVTTSPDGRRQIIRPGTLTFGGAGTQQLFGASVVDTAKKWRVVSVSGTANASVNLSLGNTGSGTQYISAQAVTAAGFDIGTFASRVISGANLYATLSGAGILTNLAIVLEQTD